jgi:hypothetical protein
MRAEKSKPGGKITTSNARTVRWITCRPQNLHGHERRRRHEKASTGLLEQGTQAPSPAPDLIPAENERQNLTRNSHSDWYYKRGHFNPPRFDLSPTQRQIGRNGELTSLRATRILALKTLQKMLQEEGIGQ